MSQMDVPMNLELFRFYIGFKTYLTINTVLTNKLALKIITIISLFSSYSFIQPYKLTLMCVVIKINKAVFIFMANRKQNKPDYFEIFKSKMTFTLNER